MRKNSSKGFSIFEILIVLVILIIIIGIGHPLWSGAVVSAQKTTALSHLRQLSQCVFLYINDNEGKLPSGYVKKPTGEIDTTAGVPKTAIFPPNSPGFQPGHANHWSNQLFVYSKQPGLYTAPGFTEFGDEKKPHVAFTYNGLLHEYPLAQVSEPSHVPVFWCGLGNIALAGQAFTNPYLILKNGSESNQSAEQRNYRPGFCDNDKSNQPIKFIKYGEAQIISQLAPHNQIENAIQHTYGSFWIYGKYSPMVYLDGSAKAIRVDEILSNMFEFNKGNPKNKQDKQGPIKAVQSTSHVDYFIPR